MKYTNKNNQSISFSLEKPFILQGLDESGAVNLYTTKSMGQDGQTYVANDLDYKDIAIRLTILAENQTNLSNLKNKLLLVFNPKNGKGILEHNNKKIECIPSSIPFFVKESTLIETCLINLNCPSPYWLDLNEIKNDIALWRGSFEFELEINDSGDGLEIGYREPSLIVNVNNEGHVSSEMTIEFLALGGLLNPSLLNINTGDYFKINKPMVAGEKIVINTQFGNKKAISSFNGINTNIFNQIDFNSSWLTLEVGDNLFRYDADNGLENLEVAIYHSNKYLGVV